MSLFDTQGNFTGGSKTLSTPSVDVGGVPVQYGGFLENQPSGPSPFKTDSIFTSPIVSYGQKSRGIIETGAIAIPNIPTSLFRLAETIINPKTYYGLAKAGAGGIQSIPGFKQFFDAASPGSEMVKTNREYFHNFAETLRDQFGSIENIKRSIAEDPVGTGLIVRGLLQGAGGVAGRAGFKETAGALEKAGRMSFPIEKVAKLPEAVKTGEKALTPEEIAGRVTQAKPKDIPAVVKTLQEVDTTGIKTFRDFSTRLDENIKGNLLAVDEALGSEKTPVRIEALTKETVAEGKTIKTNYVQKALDDLQELYEKSIAPEDEARIMSLKTKFQDEGLTPKEINDIAREYGTDFGAKAFSKTSGDPMTSVNAQAYENVRTGVKETARDLMPQAGTKALDLSTTDMIKTKKLVDNLATKVQLLENKFQKAGVLQRVGSKVVKAIDLITGHALQGIMREILQKSTEGKTLNPIELQKNLEKNLKLFDKLSEMSPQEAIQTIQTAVSIPVTNLTPYEKAIEIFKPKKLEVKNLTPDEVEILRTINVE